MSNKAPRITASEIIKILEKIGFTLTRQSGSHKIFYKEEKRVTIPFHSKEILHPKILQSILDQAGLDINDIKNNKK